VLPPGRTPDESFTTLATPHTYHAAKISPDGQQIAAFRAYGGIWLVDLERGVPTRLMPDGTAGAEWAGAITWSPDGQRIAFTSRDSPPNIGMFRVGRSDASERLTESSHTQCCLDWSPDGQFIVF
jgi:Tol biopolymer transport system component